VRVAVRERAATPTAPAVREKGNASQAAPPSEASPRPVRPLRRRVAAASEASAAARARLQQGDESLREGRLFEAVVAFREALDSDPTFATAARRLGDAYRQHNDTALAISAYERYLEMDPSAADAEEVRSALEELRAPTAKEE
ncbi:MAG TPA: tetratricopeptide repeat protein, partial [Myxococcales bacterium]|nr:tetratricopeptide repeat protein [Myxococcales bacterium]